jgi:hypothetical protein
MFYFMNLIDLTVQLPVIFSLIDVAGSAELYNTKLNINNQFYMFPLYVCAL